MATTSEKFVVYWLGYHLNPPALQSLPKGIDVLDLFLINLAPSANGTPIGYMHLGTSKDRMTKFNINDDIDYQAADAIIKALSSRSASVTAEHCWLDQ
ncbi:MAG TPA: hypothetical protein VFS77_19545 [Pyrinomonadaceae bacterium]|nr:hypothetical protein [Pyrinomonadaceae bacterium]